METVSPLPTRLTVELVRVRTLAARPCNVHAVRPSIVSLSIPTFVTYFLFPSKAVFLEQMYRAIVGDRHYHSHNSLNEDTKLSTLGGLILDNSLVSSIPLDTFTATDMVVSSTTSATETSEAEFKEVFLADW